MSLHSLDSNVLLRIARGDVPEHLVRAERLLGTPGARFTVDGVVLVELEYALVTHYGLTRAEVVETLVTLCSISSVVADVPVLQEACGIYGRRPKLSFADCYLASQAAASGAAPLYTFDEKLAKQHPGAQLVP